MTAQPVRAEAITADPRQTDTTLHTVVIMARHNWTGCIEDITRWQTDYAKKNKKKNVEIKIDYPQRTLTHISIAAHLNI